MSEINGFRAVYPGWVVGRVLDCSQRTTNGYVVCIVALDNFNNSARESQIISSTVTVKCALRAK
jgi:hypothetical protein